MLLSRCSVRAPFVRFPSEMLYLRMNAGSSVIQQINRVSFGTNGMLINLPKPAFVPGDELFGTYSGIRARTMTDPRAKRIVAVVQITTRLQQKIYIVLIN